MYLNKYEEKVIKPLFKAIAYNNRSENKNIFTLKWKNGTKINAIYVTTDEDDNGLEVDEVGYEEYYSFIMDVIDVLNFSPLDGFDSKWVKKGGSIDFNYHNFPDEIYNSNGELISKRED